MTEQKLQKLSKEELVELAKKGSCEASMWLINNYFQDHDWEDWVEAAYNHLDDFNKKDQSTIESFIVENDTNDGLDFFCDEEAEKGDLKAIRCLVRNKFLRLCDGIAWDDDLSNLAFWMIRAELEGLHTPKKIWEGTHFYNIDGAVDQIISSEEDGNDGLEPESIEWLESKAVEGNAIAMTILACTIYKYDNDDRQIYLLKKAADKGYKYAEEMLEFYLYDEFNDDNWKQKMQEAVDGDEDAQSFVGWCYCYGINVPQDFGKAAKWYKAAAIQGNSEAQSELESHLFNEKGILTDGDKIQNHKNNDEASHVQKIIDASRIVKEKMKSVVCEDDIFTAYVELQHISYIMRRDCTADDLKKIHDSKEYHDAWEQYNQASSSVCDEYEDD